LRPADLLDFHNQLSSKCTNTSNSHGRTSDKQFYTPRSYGPCHVSGGCHRLRTAETRIQSQSNLSGCVLDRISLAQGFLRVLRLPYVSIIPSVSHDYSFICHRGSTNPVIHIFDIRYLNQRKPCILVSIILHWV